MGNVVNPPGRILYLTEDPELLGRQLAGETLEWSKVQDMPLVGNISTDEITPGWVCYYYDETLGRYSLVGLRGGVIKKDAIKAGGFGVLVSGISKGCGSSREQAPFSELSAGIRIVIARSLEKIYRQNCQNIGLLTSTDFSILPIGSNAVKSLPISEFTRGPGSRSARDVVEFGGLFNYNKRTPRRNDGLASGRSPPRRRPMTLVRENRRQPCHRRRRRWASIGVTCGQAPGDSLFVRTDVRFSHEYVTPMAESLFAAALGKDAKLTDPAILSSPFGITSPSSTRVMSDAHIKTWGSKEQAASLATVAGRLRQAAPEFKLYGEVERDGKLSRIGGDLPQQGDRSDRASRSGRRRHRLAHLHGGRARLLRLRRRLHRYGQRLADQGHSRRRPRDRCASTSHGTAATAASPPRT